MPIGPSSDEAALLALASSNLVPQQHRMLERPMAGSSAPGGGGAAGAAAAGAAAGAAGGTVPSIVLRTRVGPGGTEAGATAELVMVDPNMLGECLPLHTVLPHMHCLICTAYRCAASRL